MSRIPRVLIHGQDAVTNQLIRLRPRLDLLLERIGPHAPFKLTGVGLESRSSVHGREDVPFQRSVDMSL